MNRVVTGAFILSLTLILPAGFGSVGASMEQTGVDPHQPSSENKTLSLWGRPSGNPCWTHFAQVDSESAPEGYGEETKDNGVLDVAWRCEMDPPLKVNFGVDVLQTYRGRVFIAYDAAEIQENFTMKLWMGSHLVGERMFTQDEMSPGENGNRLAYEFPVERNRWNASQDDPKLELTMRLRGDQQQQGIFLTGTPAYFRIYYGLENTSIDYPYVNISNMADEGVDGGDNKESPGFGTFVSMLAVGTASLVVLRRAKRD